MKKNKLKSLKPQAGKSTLIDQLVKTIVHKINNPLFVISGTLEMILEQKGLDNQLKKDLNIIRGQIKRIKKLLNCLFKFSSSTSSIDCRHIKTFLKEFNK